MLATCRRSESSFFSSSSMASNDGRLWWSKDLQGGLNDGIERVYAEVGANLAQGHSRNFVS